MIYQGSKRKILWDILPFIQNCINENKVDTYIEPFVGGANVIDSVNCKNRIGSDLNDELISLLIYMRDNTSIPFAPTECSFEHYCEVREDRKNKTNYFTKEYIAMIGYFASYGGRYFDGGYGRDAKGSRDIYSERLKFAINQAPKLKGIEFKSCLFEEYNPKDYKNCVFYLDPPYKDTKTYNNKNGFPYEKFYDWVKELGKNNFVFISEYSMPNEFRCIWSKEVKVLQKSDRNKGDVAIEKLFYCGKELKEKE
jgi:site-specific DNA-adenine methylase